MQNSSHNETVRVLKILVSVALLTGLLSGCKSYHLGSPSEVPFESIYLKPVSNQSYAPQAQPIISAMLRENFIRDARVKVVAKEETADAVLLVTLANYGRNSTARRAQDTAIADVFDVQLAAKVSLLDQKNENYLFENRPITVTTNAYTSNPYASDLAVAYQLSERQALEILSRDMAREITNMVLNPW